MVITNQLQNLPYIIDFLVFCRELIIAVLQVGKLKARLVVRAGLTVGIQQATRGGLEAESRPPVLSYSGGLQFLPVTEPAL